MKMRIRSAAGEGVPTSPGIWLLHPTAIEATATTLSVFLQEQSARSTVQSTQKAQLRACVNMQALPASTGSRCNLSHGFTGTPLCTASRAAVARRPLALSVQARYKGVNTDLTAVPQFKNHESDTGSSEVQVAQLTARITQLTKHLQQNRKDYSSTRGLMMLLGRRKHLMEYLYKTQREKYESLLLVLKIRPLKIRAARGLTSQLRVPETDKEISLAEAERMAPLEAVEATSSVDQASVDAA